MTVAKKRLVRGKHAGGRTPGRSERAGLSQHQLAEEVGLAGNNLQRLESGTKALPRFDTVARLAAALGLSLDDFAAELGYQSRPGPIPVDPARAQRLTRALSGVQVALKALDTEVDTAMSVLKPGSARKRPKRNPPKR